MKEEGRALRILPFGGEQGHSLRKGRKTASVLQSSCVLPSSALKRNADAVHASGTTIELLALPDLVKAKKTQRDKDWLMLRRLIEADMAHHQADATALRIRFWLEECRSAGALIALAGRHPEQAAEAIATRSLLTLAIDRDDQGLRQALAAEEGRERDADRAYWAPLRAELERLRREKTSGVRASRSRIHASGTAIRA